MVLEFTLTLLCSILVGMAIGLLPVLPMYFGPFLLYYVYGAFPPEFLLIYWIGLTIGSQFFGSVATITTGIPGESSALIYLKDIERMSLHQKNKLLYRTAFGSMIASIISILLVYGIVQVFTFNDLQFLTSVKFQIVIYTFALASFVYFDRFWPTLFLVLFGIMLGPKNNYVLPQIWFDVQTMFQGTTMFIMILGLLILPEMLFNSNITHVKENHFIAQHDKNAKWSLKYLKDVVIGFLSGLVPGPSASLSSTLAYRFNKGTTTSKIVSAETANNSAVVSMLIPLFLIGLPITEGAIIFTNILDAKMVEINEVILQPSVFGIRSLELIMLSALVLTVSFYALSINFIDKYIKFLLAIQYSFKTVLLVLVAILVTLDIWSAEITLPNYLILFSFFSAIGLLLKKHNINPIPFMFAVLLGDKIIWVYIQFFSIYL